MVANNAKKPEIQTLNNVFWCMNLESFLSSFLFTSASEAATRAVIVCAAVSKSLVDWASRISWRFSSSFN